MVTGSSRCRPLVRASLAVAVGMVMLAGCASHRDLPYLPGGPIVRTHPKPIEGGFYENFDRRAHSIDITQVEVASPVKRQVVLVATVRDKDGKPLPCRRVHWILSRGGVGDLVEVDESGWTPTRGNIVTNTFAETFTNVFDHVLDRGTSDTSDDIHLKQGQTWAAITAPIEGDTFVTAYAPGVYNWQKHKAFATIHWVDANFAFPASGCRPSGRPVPLVTRVTRASDGTPLSGWTVRYTLRKDGPAARLSAGRGGAAEVKTNDRGEALVSLAQAKPIKIGTSIVDIVLLKPVWDKCCKNLVLKTMGKGQVRIQWDLAQLQIAKKGPAKAVVCSEVCEYVITVRNASECAAAAGVVVTDTLPAQMGFVSSEPAAKPRGNKISWNLGTLKPGEAKQITLRLKPKAAGTARNVATATATGLKPVTAEVVTKLAAMQLKVTKRALKPVVFLGEEAVFEIKITNTGTIPSSAVQLVDTFDKRGLQAKGGPKVKKIVLDVPALAPGQASERILLSLKTMAAGQFTNTVQLTGKGCVGTVTAKATVKVVEAKLAVKKTGPTRTFLKKKVPLTITVSNPAKPGSGADATNVVLVDKLPAGTSFVSADSKGVFAGGKVQWQIGTLKPGQSKTVKLLLQAEKKGKFVNTVVATADRGLHATDDHAVVVKGVAALLIEVIDTVDPVMFWPGSSEKTSYVITVTNQGTSAAEKIRLTFEVPRELKFLSTEGPTQFKTRKMRGRTVIVYDPVPSIGVGTKATFKVFCEASKPGDARFRATMSSDSDLLTQKVVEEESTHVYSGQ